jgi:hypothetical protein
MATRMFKLGDWLYIAPFAFIGFVLGVYGFATCSDCNDVTSGQPLTHVSSLQAVTHTLALIKGVGNFPLDQEHWPLFVAQILLPAWAFVSVFKLAIYNIRRDARILWARRLTGHTIVCGLGETGRQIVENFCDAGQSVVAITLVADTAHAAACERLGVAVLEGDAGQLSMLKFAGLGNAQSLIIACGSDGTNLEIGMRARDALASDKERSVKILPELRSNWLCDLIEAQGVTALGSARTEFRLFNLNTNAARALLRSATFMQHAPDATPQPHLLFAGFGQMGAEILMRAACSNFAVPGQRLSATILDERGPASVATAEARCSHIREIADLELINCQFTADDAAWHATVLGALQKRPPLAVIVTLRLDDVALHAATRFRKILDKLGQFPTPIFVRIREQRKLGEFLSQLEVGTLFHDRLRPFGSLSYLTSPEILLDQSLDVLARAAHEVWLETNTNSRSPAAVPWEKLPESYKQSNRALADYIPIRLRRCGLRLVDNAGPVLALHELEIEKLAELEHWRWCVELSSMGWQFAEKRNDFLKLHNKLVNWPSLPDDTKDYNRNIARSIPEIASAAGMSVRRDRILFAPLENRELDNLEPGIQPVIVADPEAPYWPLVVQRGGARIWALLREGTSPDTLLKRLQSDSLDAVGSIEIWITEREFAQLRQALPPNNI